MAIDLNLNVTRISFKRRKIFVNHDNGLITNPLFMLVFTYIPIHKSTIIHILLIFFRVYLFANVPFNQHFGHLNKNKYILVVVVVLCLLLIQAKRSEFNKIIEIINELSINIIQSHVFSFMSLSLNHIHTTYIYYQQLELFQVKEKKYYICKIAFCFCICITYTIFF